MAKKPRSEFDREAATPETKAKKMPEPGDDGQLELIDVEHPEDKDIMRLARAIRKFDKERSAAQAKASEKRVELAKLLHDHKIKRYKRGETDITLEVKDSVSVKLAKTKAEGDSSDADEGEE